MKVMLQLHVSHEQLDDIESHIVEWVQKYERYAPRPQSVLLCGPVWTTWTFHMEQFCGMLQNSLHSWSHPWSNLNKVLLHCTYLEQLWMQYDLSEELANEGE